MLARIALVIAAVVVAACLALTLRAIRLEDAARGALAGGAISPAAVAHAERLLRDAEELNPDIRPLLVRGALLTGVNQPQRAVALLRAVLRREPDNAAAASLLVSNLRRYDPAAADAAERRLRVIAPPVPGG
ncbi:MAG: hypothetical protein QOG63_1613 [Thermoleophilaceae bacterium]|nr:hypothetical protein [Thermoleophilaceae bacterium]